MKKSTLRDELYWDLTVYLMIPKMIARDCKSDYKSAILRREGASSQILTLKSSRQCARGNLRFSAAKKDLEAWFSISSAEGDSTFFHSPQSTHSHRRATWQISASAIPHPRKHLQRRTHYATLPYTVEPRSNGPATNGIPPIIDAYS